MAKPLSTGSEQAPAEHNRRASDRTNDGEDARQTGRRAGDQLNSYEDLKKHDLPKQTPREYGRRASDGVYVAPKNRKTSIAIWCSFIFSTGLILWSFSRPFLGQASSKLHENVPEAELAKMEVQARMSADDYVRYTQRIEQDLRDEFQSAQSRPKSVSKTKKEINADWQERIEQRKTTIKQMKKENKGKPFLEGTVQWEHEKELEKMLEDSPPQEK